MVKKRRVMPNLKNEYNAALNRYYDTQMDCIWEAVARVCNVPDDALKSKSRVTEWKMARFYFFYFAKTRTDVTWKQIGLYAGGRDHSTAIHGYDQICDWSSVEKPVRRRIQEIEDVLDGRFVENQEFYSAEKKLQNGFL
jgi:chromosomal replication initiation ATPase DnaA